jgi:hypothetical protein
MNSELIKEGRLYVLKPRALRALFPIAVPPEYQRLYNEQAFLLKVTRCPNSLIIADFIWGEEVISIFLGTKEETYFELEEILNQTTNEVILG